MQQYTLNNIKTKPARVFVGGTEQQTLAFEVLKYSIFRFAKINVVVFPLWELVKPIKIARKENRPRTPFSFQRFDIPRICGFQGKAIYMDSDMLCFDDISKVWNLNIDDCNVIAPPKDNRNAQFAFMFINCESTKWHIDEDIVPRLESGTLKYKNLMGLKFNDCQIKHTLSQRWNDLDHWQADTSVLHYTDMNMQPWLSAKNRHCRLWERFLINALNDCSYPLINMKLLEDEYEKGNIRPSLFFSIKTSRPYKEVAYFDRSWKSPHKR